jgi:hypothetical protein
MKLFIHGTEIAIEVKRKETVNSIRERLETLGVEVSSMSIRKLKRVRMNEEEQIGKYLKQSATIYVNDPNQDSDIDIEKGTGKSRGKGKGKSASNSSGKGIEQGAESEHEQSAESEHEQSAESDWHVVRRGFNSGTGREIEEWSDSDGEGEPIDQVQLTVEHNAETLFWELLTPPADISMAHLEGERLFDLIFAAVDHWRNSSPLALGRNHNYAAWDYSYTVETRQENTQAKITVVLTTPIESEDDRSRYIHPLTNKHIHITTQLAQSIQPTPRARAERQRGGAPRRGAPPRQQ